MSEIETTTKTAKRIRECGGMRGDAAVYELTPPYDGNNFVVVSAVDLDFGGFVIPEYRSSETMIFPSDGEKVTDYGELAMVGFKSHTAALIDIGYEVAS